MNFLMSALCLHFYAFLTLSTVFREKFLIFMMKSISEMFEKEKEEIQLVKKNFIDCSFEGEKNEKEKINLKCKFFMILLSSGEIVQQIEERLKNLF